MRLGGYYGAASVAELAPLCDKLDPHGLSAVGAPWGFEDWDADACAAFGQKARQLGIVVGEAGMWSNLLTTDKDEQAKRIDQTKRMLRNAEIMGCHCVVTLVGSKHPSDHPLAPQAYLYTDACRKEFREVVLRVLDGLVLRRTRYVIEPWHNTFFYQPDDIRAFIDSVDHPSFGLHLDQMNMVNQANYFNTTDLINRTFDLLADKVASVHLKDIRCDHSHMFLKWDEVHIGDGVMDYDTYLTRLARLPVDTPCYCEHFPEERDYTLSFARLHEFARRAGVGFAKRVPAP